MKFDVEFWVSLDCCEIVETPPFILTLPQTPQDLKEVVTWKLCRNWYYTHYVHINGTCGGGVYQMIDGEAYLLPEPVQEPLLSWCTMSLSHCTLPGYESGLEA